MNHAGDPILELLDRFDDSVDTHKQIPEYLSWIAKLDPKIQVEAFFDLAAAELEWRIRLREKHRSPHDDRSAKTAWVGDCFGRCRRLAEVAATPTRGQLSPQTMRAVVDSKADWLRLAADEFLQRDSQGDSIRRSHFAKRLAKFLPFSRQEIDQHLGEVLAQSCKLQVRIVAGDTRALVTRLPAEFRCGRAGKSTSGTAISSEASGRIYPDADGLPKLIIATRQERKVSRDHIRIRLENHRRVRIVNTSAKRRLLLQGSHEMQAHAEVLVKLPVAIEVTGSETSLYLESCPRTKLARDQSF